VTEVEGNAAFFNGGDATVSVAFVIPLWLVKRAGGSKAGERADPISAISSNHHHALARSPLFSTHDAAAAAAAVRVLSQPDQAAHTPVLYDACPV
jgi:hypothetical protein